MNETGVVNIGLLAHLFGIVLFIASSKKKKKVWLETVLSCQLRSSMVCVAQCSMQCLLQTKEKEVLLILAAPFSVKPEVAGKVLIFVSVFVKDLSRFLVYHLQRARCQQNPEQNSALCSPTSRGALRAWQQSRSHPSLSHPLLAPLPLNSNPAKCCPTLILAVGFSVSTDN